MVAEVFRFELAYRLRQPSTWGYAAFLFGVPFLLMHAIDGSSLPLNAPEMVADFTTVIGVLGMLVTAALFGDAATRDVHTRMHALFYTSPLHEGSYLVGRFLGTLVANAALALLIPLGHMTAAAMPYMSAGKFGPFRLAAYVQPTVLLILPNMAVAAVVMFAAAALTRKAVATYLGGVAVIALRILADEITDGLSNRTISALADPSGATALADATRFWTHADRATRLVGWPPLLVWNRVLWLAAAAALLALVVARFRYAHPAGEGRRRWRRRVVDTAPERLAPLVTFAAPAAGRTFGARTWLRQTLAVARRSLREVAGNRAFLIILAGAIFLVFAVGWDVGSEIFGTSTWPVTHLLAATVVGGVVGPVMALVIALLAGELVWRERDVRVSEIADVAPVPDGAALLGRFLALVAMLVALQAVFMGAGMALQALRGYHRFEPGVYLQILFGVKLVDYLLLAALAMAVHVVVNQKYVGHLVVVLYFVFTTVPGMFRVRHRMLVYGSDPGWVWSDMNGLGPFLEGLVWFKLYWAAWALLLGIAASAFFVRGREGGLARRGALARRRLAGPALGAAATAAVLVMTLGGFVFYNTNVLNEYRTPEQEAARRADYERHYKRYDDAARPSIAAARLRVELRPGRRAAEIRGTYRLVNRTGRPLDSLHVQTNPAVETRSLALDRPARLTVDDARLHFRVYVLERPLAPGDSLALSFDVAFAPSGFRALGAATDVTQNGAYFDRRWYPMLGYQSSQEIENAETRREHGLPPRALPPSAGDVETRSAEDSARGRELVDVETVIGTDPRQIAVTPGTLVREWREQGRRYFHYRSQGEPRFAAPILAAEYAVRDSVWHDRATGRAVKLRVYHHPAHDFNVGRMLRSMAASLDYYTEQFGPYQFPELRIVEFPRYASFARAHPHTIAFSEGSAFLTRVDSGEVDRPFFVVAHETAHQWWGGQVIPAGALGAGMASETLAQYSSMMVMERTLGRDMARRFYDFQMSEYLRGRRVYTNREAPLLDVERQGYVYYFKGGVAMYALRERIGADRVNAALRRFLERFRDTGGPGPTSRDLYAELQAVTPDSVRPFLRDLFEEITLWNVKADSARAEPAAAGGWRVTLDVTAAKARADSVGKETPIPMDETVEIGVFGEPGADGSLGTPLYLARHRVRSGPQRIVVTVPARPARAGIDPHRTLIERERDDNVTGVTLPAPPKP